MPCVGFTLSFSADQAQRKVQLAAGLINSSRHVVKWAGPEATSDDAYVMASKALGISGWPGAIATEVVV